MLTLGACQHLVLLISTICCRSARLAGPVAFGPTAVCTVASTDTGAEWPRGHRHSSRALMPIHRPDAYSPTCAYSSTCNDANADWPTARPIDLRRIAADTRISCRLIRGTRDREGSGAQSLPTRIWSPSTCFLPLRDVRPALGEGAHRKPRSFHSPAALGSCCRARGLDAANPPSAGGRGSMMLVGQETITFAGTLNTASTVPCQGLMVCDNAVAIFAPGATLNDANALIVGNDAVGTLRAEGSGATHTLDRHRQGAGDARATHRGNVGDRAQGGTGRQRAEP